MTSKSPREALNDASRAARELAVALGVMVETAFPRDEPRPVPDEKPEPAVDGTDLVAYSQSARLVVTLNSAGSVVSVRYGAIELPYVVNERVDSYPHAEPSPIVSMRLRRQPS